MTYLLVAWVIVASNSAGVNKDWRVIGEFHSGYGTAQTLCENAAKDLGLEKYRCVRNY